MPETILKRKKPRSLPAKIYRTVNNDTIGGMKLHSKPHCPWCDKPLVFLYGDLPSGAICIKCRTCGHLAFVTFPDLRIEKIIAE